MKMRIRRTLIQAGLLSVVLPLFAASISETQAASFDCAKATTKVEKMICADAELSTLDDELSAAYKTATQDEQRAESIRQAQKQWIRERNSCADAACVKKAYGARLQALPPSAGNTASSDTQGTGVQNDAAPNKKPLYGHCVDVLQDPRNCGRFQSGKGYTVCEKYLEHLNSLSKMPKCEVPVPPSFQRPDWEEIDVMQHLDWAYQAETIRFGKTGWHTLPDFTTWQKEFLAEKESGRIVPSMRKVRVKPLGEGKEIMILAYTRNREECQEVAKNPPDKATYWSDVGYAHFLLPETLGTPSVEKLEEGGRAAHQTEMLLYAGRPYFVTEFGPAIYDTPGIMIYAIGPWRYPTANESEYLFKDFCIFEPFSRNTSK